MPRKLRLEYPGAIYHVMNRGDRREDIFRDHHDRERFLATLGEACSKTGWQVHAYCLMRNHFHLVIETPRPNLVSGMKWLLGVYTKRFNIRHKLCGHLFAGRYKALAVDGSGSGYLKTVCDYVHLNPVRAKLLKSGERLEKYRWSSYGAYVGAPRSRPAWLRVDRVFGEHGIPEDTKAGRTEFARRLAGRKENELSAGIKQIRRGWCFGSEKFRKELLAAAARKVGPNHYGSDRQETDIEKAERLVKEELSRLDWAEADLSLHPKGHRSKVAMARRLRKDTTMTLKWIANRLGMGSWTYVSNLLAQNRHN